MKHFKLINEQKKSILSRVNQTTDSFIMRADVIRTFDSMLNVKLVQVTCTNDSKKSVCGLFCFQF